MDQNLSKQFELLEGQKAQLLKDFGSWSREQLYFKPGSDQWSVLEVLQHVVNIDTGVTKYLCKYQHDISQEKLGLGAWWRSMLLRLFLRSPMKVKAPNVRNIQPLDTKELETLSADWAKSRAILYDYLKKFPQDKLMHFVFKHPLSGKFNIEQTLIFIYYHAHHHDHQLNRIISHSEFPKAKKHG